MANATTAAMLSAAHEDFVALAGGLGDTQWAADSWCRGWTVRDVIEHVAFHVHRESVADLLGSTPKRTELMLTRRDATTRGGLLALLGAPLPAKAGNLINVSEVVIHAEDIRGALELPSTVAPDTLGACLAYCSGRTGNLLVIGRKTRVARDVHLRATDVDWEHGTGPDVHGPGLALLMAIAGRSPALAELSGAGVARMASRVDAAVGVGSA